MFNITGTNLENNDFSSLFTQNLQYDFTSQHLTTEYILSNSDEY